MLYNKRKKGKVLYYEEKGIINDSGGSYGICSISGLFICSKGDSCTGNNGSRDREERDRCKEGRDNQSRGNQKAEEAGGAANDMLAGETGDIAKPGDGKGQKVVLITIDSMDQHWVNMDKGCKKAAEELGCEYKWIAPDVKDDAKQIECVNNAVADGATAILVAANGPDAITAALEEADEAGVKIVQVDSFANYPCVQKLGTDNRAAGKIAGEKVLEALEARV